MRLGSRAGLRYGVPAAVAVVAAIAMMRAFTAGPEAGAVPGRDLLAGSRPAAPESPDARSAWHRGLFLAERAGADDLERALESFTEAARRAPRFAPARAKRAEVLSRLAFRGGREMGADLSAARSEARAALAIDDALPEAHLVLAKAALHLDWDEATARREIRRAIELDPDDGHSHLAAATLLSASGRHGEAVAEAERAVELDPSSNLIRADLGWFYLAAGRYEDSVRACREALDLDPDFRPALNFLVLASQRLGRIREAADTAREILEQDGASPEALADLASRPPQESIDAYHRRNLRRAEEAYAESPRNALGLSLAHAAMGHRDEALRYLEESFEARDGWLVFAAGFPQFQSLRDDPAFRKLIARLGLPAEKGPGGDSSSPSTL